MNLRGTLYILIFLFFISVAGVYQGHLTQNISPLVFLFYVSLTSILFFSAISLSKKSSDFFNRCVLHRRTILLLNVTNFFVWGCYVYGLKYLEPAIAVMIANAIGPLSVVLFSKYLRPQSKIYLSEKIAGSGMMISLLFIIFSTLSGKSAVSGQDITSLAIGIFVVLVMGIGQVLFSFFSKSLHESRFTATEISAIRFPLTAIIAFVFLDKQEAWHLLSSLPDMLNVLLICIFGTLIPIFFFQKGIKLVEPIFLSILMLIEPVIMFAGQVFDPRLHVSLFSYIGVFFICVFSLVSVVGRFLESQKTLNQSG